MRYFIIITMLISGCTYIQTRDIKVVETEPSDCALIEKVEVLTTRDNGGHYEFKKKALELGGNTIYVPPSIYEEGSLIQEVVLTHGPGGAKQNFNHYGNIYLCL